MGACSVAASPRLATIADVIEAVLAEGDPHKAKGLLRLKIEELRVNGREEILPTYRLPTPAVCAMSEKVEPTGLEPVASSVPRWRSPN